MTTPCPLTSEELASLASLLPCASGPELAQIQALLLGTAEPLLWAPRWQNVPQCVAYEHPADVLGYGGAAGGGKSQVLLGLAVTRHRRSLILRREAAQVRALVDDLRKICGPHGRFNENTLVWRGLPGGRQVELGGVANPGDEQKWRGRPHDFLGVDEADQFPEHVVRFLMGWLRTTLPGQRCRAVLCFNPPATAEGRWLIPFFGPWLDRKHPGPALPGELRWYATLPDGKEVARPDGSPFEAGGKLFTPKSRSFIPSRVEDNPDLMATGYLAQLQALPEPLRSQLLYGDMTAGMQDDPWQVIPTAWVEGAMARWRPDGGDGVALSCLGVDVARGGRAQTVLARRRRAWLARLERHAGRDTPDGPAVAGLVLRALVGERPGVPVHVDVIGAGGSPFDHLKARPGVRAVNVSEGTDARDRSGTLEFANLRAYMHWHMREALDPAGPCPAALPPDRELLADLTAPRWSHTAQGVRVEKKEDVEARLGRTVDAGEACMLAFLPVLAPTPRPQVAGTRPATRPPGQQWPPPGLPRPY
jgi:hypothetical protein